MIPPFGRLQPASTLQGDGVRAPEADALVPRAHSGAPIHKPSSARRGDSIHARRTPKLKRRPMCDVVEVPIGRQHGELAADAKLRQQGIDGSDLNPVATALVTQVRRQDVVLPRGRDHGDRLETADHPCRGIGSANALEQPLEHDPGGENRSPELRASRRRHTSGLSGGESRLKARDRTLVSTNMLTGGCVRVCSRSRHSIRGSRTDP